MTEELAVFVNQKYLGILSLDGHNDKYSLVYDQTWLLEDGYAVSPNLKPEECRSESVKWFLCR